MPDSQPESNPTDTKSFWSTLPGVLTAVGGLIAGIAALLTALVSAGVLGGRPTPIPYRLSSRLRRPQPRRLSRAHSYDRAVTPQVTAASLPSVAPLASTPVPANNVLMEDDFSSPRNTWLSEVTEQAEKGYEDGEFRITVYQPSILPGVTQPATRLR